MNAELKAELKAINDKLEWFEHQGSYDEADAYLKENRWILNYDSKGNWVGLIANENGWTQ